MAEDRRSAIGNERVGARLGRLFQRNRTQEERDILEAYRRQIPVDEVRRRREAAAAPAPSPMAEARRDEPEARAAAPAPEPPPASEVRAAAEARNAARTQRRPNTRMSPRAAASAAPTEADILNDISLSLARGEANASPAAETIRRRMEELGGSGDIGAASARARGEQVGPPGDYNMKKGGKVAIKKMKAGGVVKSSASNRGDGCAARGKTKGRMV